MKEQIKICDKISYLRSLFRKLGEKKDQIHPK